MTEVMMKQCQLNRDGAKQVAWIEERGATIGATVEFKPSGELWVVEEVYDLTQPRSVIAENERNWSTHRKATDI